MGENPSCVIHTGCPSYDGLFALSSDDDCWQGCDIDSILAPARFLIQPKSFLLVLMHPVTDNSSDDLKDFDTMLDALFHIKLPTILFIQTSIQKQTMIKTYTNTEGST